MGRNFAALLQTELSAKDLLDAIAELEAGVNPPALARVVTCGAEFGHAFAERASEPATWRPLPDWDRVLPSRPSIPTLQAVLELPSGFGLMVGHGVIRITHYLRWISFLEEEEWQPVMIEAVQWFCSHFSATDCVVAYDSHPMSLRFLEGATFREALEHANLLGEREVGSIKEMLIDLGDSDELVIGGPEDWRPVYLWDSKNYFRPNI
jgi:hypothetical protein